MKVLVRWALANGYSVDTKKRDIMRDGLYLIQQHDSCVDAGKIFSDGFTPVLLRAKGKVVAIAADLWVS